MRRVVLDTNILVSALMFGGTPKSLLEAAQAGKFSFLSSLDLLDELDETLAGTKFKLPVSEIREARSRLETYAEIVSPHLQIQAVVADPDDDRVLECAVAGRADFIVSGDRHLLNLVSYRGIPILTVRQFMDRFSPAS